MANAQATDSASTPTDITKELNNIKCAIRYLVEINEPVLCEKFGEEITHGFNQIAKDIYVRMDRLISAMKD